MRGIVCFVLAVTWVQGKPTADPKAVGEDRDDAKNNEKRQLVLPDQPQIGGFFDPNVVYAPGFQTSGSGRPTLISGDPITVVGGDVRSRPIPGSVGGQGVFAVDPGYLPGTGTSLYGGLGGTGGRGVGTGFYSLGTNNPNFGVGTTYNPNLGFGNNYNPSYGFTPYYVIPNRGVSYPNYYNTGGYNPNDFQFSGQGFGNYPTILIYPGFGGTNYPGFGGSNYPGFGGSNYPGFGGSNYPGFGGTNYPGLGGTNFYDVPNTVGTSGLNPGYSIVTTNDPRVFNTIGGGSSSFDGFRGQPGGFIRPLNTQRGIDRSGRGRSEEYTQAN